MNEHSVIPRRGAARLLFGPFLAFGLGSPASALLDEDPQEKVAAAKVAKKVEKARRKKHEDQPDRDALRDFNDELADYAELHKKLVAKIGIRETEAAQRALVAAIIEKRVKARQGDVFVPEVQPLFRRLIWEQLKGPDTQAARKAVAEGNPGHEEDSIPVVVKVNGVYPSGAPRSTVPASVLLTLPPLPECLHYRFVNRDLVLVDAVAQLIVDFLPAVTPALPVA